MEGWRDDKGTVVHQQFDGYRNQKFGGQLVEREGFHCLKCRTGLLRCFGWSDCTRLVHNRKAVLRGDHGLCCFRSWGGLRVLRWNRASLGVVPEILGHIVRLGKEFRPHQGTGIQIRTWARNGCV